MAAASRVGLWRFVVAVSFIASIARSKVPGLLPGLAWYVIQFGPLAATVVYLLTRDRAPRRAVHRRITACLGLFVVVALLSVVTSSFPAQALSQVGLLSLMFAFLALTMSRRWTTPETVRGDMVFVFGLICAAQIIGLAGVAVGPAWAIADYGRFQGVFPNANYVGLLCAPGIALGAYIMHTRSRGMWVLPAIGIVLLAVALTLSGSRGALLALGVGALSLLSFRESRKTAMLLLVGVVIVGLSSVVGTTTPSAGTAQLPTSAPTPSAGTAQPPTSAPTPSAGTAQPPTSAPTPSAGTAQPPTGAPTPSAGTAQPPTGAPAASADVQLSKTPFAHTPANYEFTGGRLQIYADVLARWSRTPWLGTGYRTTQRFGEMGGFEAHNVYLSVLAQTGILGAVAFAVLLLTILRAGSRIKPHRLLLGTAVAVLAGELAQSSLFGWGSPTATLGWLMLLAWAASGRTQGDDRSSPGVESEAADDPTGVAVSQPS